MAYFGIAVSRWFVVIALAVCSVRNLLHLVGLMAYLPWQQNITSTQLLGGGVTVNVTYNRTENADICSDLSRWTPPQSCPLELASKATHFIEKTVGFTNSSNASSGYASADFAIAIVSLGAATQNNIAERAIRSLRLRGRYCGPVVLVHDRSDGRYDDFSLSDGNVALLRVPFSAHMGPEEDSKDVEMRAKRFKTLLFDLLLKGGETPLKGIEYLLLIDADIIAGDPLGALIEHVRERMINGQGNGAPPGRLLMFPEETGPEYKAERKKKDGDRRAIFHSGVIGMHITRSVSCLSIWRDLLDSGKFRRDQKALLHMLYEDPKLMGQCEVLPLDRESYFQMATRSTMEVGISSSLIHVTGARYQTVPKEFFPCVLMLEEEFVEPIRVERYGNKKKYGNKYWKDLPGNAKTAAALIGFDEESWNGNYKNVSIYAKSWHELGDEEQAAISLLGMRSNFERVGNPLSGQEKQSASLNILAVVLVIGGAATLVALFYL